MTAQIDQADLLLSQVDGAEVRVNIGDTVTGAGWGSGVAVWGVDGLLSVPNAATGSGAAQGLYLTQGNQRRVLASRDTRWAGPFGTLAAGDRALVSDCDAGLMLDRSANVIKLQAGAGVEVTVDGDAGTVTVQRGGVSAVFSSTSLSLTFNPLDLPVPPARVVLSATGVDVTGILSVGGVPMTVP